MFLARVLSLAVIVLLACTARTFANVSFISNPIWLSASRVTEGQPVRISSAISTSGEEDVTGTVTFYAGETAIGSADFALPSSVGGVVVSVSWAPAAGSYPISAKITRAVVAKQGGAQTIETSASIKAGELLRVDPDNDRDTIADDADDDDDNDGITDVDEKKNSTNPLKAEPTHTSTPNPQVAGASTTDILENVSTRAQSIGKTIFTQSENLRTRGATYFDQKLKEAQSNADTDLATSTESGTLVAAPKSFTEQVKDIPSVLNHVKRYAYAGLSFVFNNVYAFYLLVVAVVLWVLRKIWKRHSLD